MTNTVDSSQATKKSLRKRSGWRRIFGILGVVAALIVVVAVLAAIFPPVRSLVGTVAPPLTTHPFRIDGPAMEPTYHPGQTLLVQDYASGNPQRGDVVIYHPSSDVRLSYCGRIIGLPGEGVQVDAQGAVTINGTLLSEPYVKFPGNPSGVIFGKLGPNTYFLLGDNRLNSADSRAFGPVPRENIVGKVVGVVGS